MAMDKCRFPLSRERAPRGQAGQAGHKRTEAFYEKDKLEQILRKEAAMAMETGHRGCGNGGKEKV